jgi:MFS family permease
VVSVIAQGGLVGRMARWIGERKTALAGAALLAAGMAGMALAPTLPLMLAALAVTAFGQGTSSPSVSSLISRQGGPGDQGRLLGVNQSLSALGRVLGPVGGGVALAHVGLAAPFLAAATVAIGAAAVLAALAGALA